MDRTSPRSGVVCEGLGLRNTAELVPRQEGLKRSFVAGGL